MRMIVLSALFGLGLGLAGLPAANAAPAAGFSPAIETGSMLQDVQYYRRPRCRSVRVCHRTWNGYRRCHIERVCRRW